MRTAAPFRVAHRALNGRCRTALEIYQWGEIPPKPDDRTLPEKIEGQEKEKVLNAIKDGLAEATGVSHGRARRRGGGRVHDGGVSPVGYNWS